MMLHRHFERAAEIAKADAEAKAEIKREEPKREEPKRGRPEREETPKRANRRKAAE